jgi:exodeoxyribonuclease VII large subunit
MGKTNFFDFRESVSRPAGPRRPTPAQGSNGSDSTGSGTNGTGTNGTGNPAPPTRTPAAPPKPLTVSQLTAVIDGALRATLPPSVLVKGEVSNFKRNGASGHLYFTLKDPGACIDCVMFKNEAGRLKFDVDDGLEMLAEGRVAVYAQRGRYQLYVDRLQPLGRGALELAFLQLRAKLEAERLFDEARKRPIPEYPRRIVVVSSTQTAALQDVLKVLRRFAWLKLMVYPVPVQGEGAGQKIAAAIAHLNRTIDAAGGADLLMLVRGGGSLEDLWAFNEECVARAIAASRLPVVTGIGHEVDTSIADLVADYWAHTPTEAARVVTQHWREARETLDGRAARLGREARNLLQDARHRLAAVERHEAFRRPMDRVNSLRQLLDDRHRSIVLLTAARLRTVQWRVHELDRRLEQAGPSFVLERFRTRLADARQRLAAAGTRRLLRSHERLGRLDGRFSGADPRHRVRLLRERLVSLENRLCCGVALMQQRRRERVESLARFLQAVGPEQVLRRGYTITFRKKGGEVLKGATQVRPGDKLVTRFADGEVESTAGDPRQPGLFE